MQTRYTTAIWPAWPAALILLLTLIAGCERAPATSATGPAHARPRIISLSPAATLQLVQLGAADLLVGVTPYDRDILPADRRDTAVVGDYFNIHYESLLALKPTVVVVQVADDRMQPRLRDLARQQGFQIVNIRLDTVDDLYATVRRLGQAAGCPQRAETKIVQAQAQLRAIREKIADRPRPRVLYIIGKNPLFVAGGGRFMDDMITAAGGQNTGATIGKDFPEINREILIKLAPEVILIAAPNEPPGAGVEDPRIVTWMELPTPAGKSGRVHLVTSPNGQLASLDIADEALVLARLLHPDLADWQPVLAPVPAAVPAEAP